MVSDHPQDKDAPHDDQYNPPEMYRELRNTGLKQSRGLTAHEGETEQYTPSRAMSITTATKAQLP